jgi:hypothetical protein
MQYSQLAIVSPFFQMKKLRLREKKEAECGFE